LPAAFPQGRLEAHLEAWTKDIASVRLHGTAGGAPIVRFPREQAAVHSGYSPKRDAAARRMQV
jgi:hypothetical protein